jgi:hypothetical protein
MRESLFISHSSEDDELCAKFKRALNIGGNLAPMYWSDGELAPGDDWETKIETKLRDVKGALLLVTRHFLQSDYIQNRELPKILRRVDKGTIALWWVPIDQNLSNEELEACGLSKREAALDLKKPLSILEPEVQAAAIGRLCAKIKLFF